MKKAIFVSCHFKMVLLILLLSNFSAFAQKTTIWVVNRAEKADKSESLSDAGRQRATDLMKTLKHEDVQVIYTTSQKSSAETAAPLAAKAKILPRVYADSIQKFVAKLKLNFIGKNVLVIADYNTIIPMLSALGVSSPFDALSKGDHDQLFTVIIKSSGETELAIQYFGKSHHDNAIPQSYILDNFSPGIPGR